MKRKALMIALATASLSTSAFAADVGVGASGDANVTAPPTSVTSQGEGFAQLDANGDGNISREEAQSDPRLAGQWDNLDSNRDGNVDQSEFSALEGHAPSTVAPEGQPEGMNRPGATMPAPSGSPGMSDTAPGVTTNPGASEAAPGHM